MLATPFFQSLQQGKWPEGHLFVFCCSQSVMLKSLWDKHHYVKLLTQNQSIWERVTVWECNCYSLNGVLIQFTGDVKAVETLHGSDSRLHGLFWPQDGHSGVCGREVAIPLQPSLREKERGFCLIITCYICGNIRAFNIFKHSSISRCINTFLFFACCVKYNRSFTCKAELPPMFLINV